MKLLIKNVVVFGKECDIHVVDGIIKRIAKNVTYNADKTIDGNGLTALPAFVDMHTHLREPGFERKEDIESGSRAAVRGGYASVCCMPNTNPVIDNKCIVSYVVNRAKEVDLARVYPIASITKGMKGEELTNFGSVKAFGAVAVSDDGMPVTSSNTMRLAIEYAKPFGLPVISHCEDFSIADGGVVNEGYHATVAGLKGISRVAEEAMVAREILIAESLDSSVHVAHISTTNSVNLVRDAKKRGAKVTAETCPHYIALTDEEILSYDTDTKVNPPLREERDRKNIIEGIKDGTIDAIATDHAPHHADDKNVEYNYAANGISGIETAFSVAYTYLVRSGEITLKRLSELMTDNPANIMNIPYGELKVGGLADITLVDLDEKYTVDSSEFFSKGKNTPFEGKELYGRVKTTVVNGEIKYDKGEIVR